MSTHSEHVQVLKTEVLSDNWYVLRKVTFRLRKRDGSWEVQSREAYDRGNGATILLYDQARRTVVVVRTAALWPDARTRATTSSACSRTSAKDEASARLRTNSSCARRRRAASGRRAANIASDPSPRSAAMRSGVTG